MGATCCNGPLQQGARLLIGMRFADPLNLGLEHPWLQNSETEGGMAVEAMPRKAAIRPSVHPSVVAATIVVHIVPFLVLAVFFDVSSNNFEKMNYMTSSS